MPIRFITSGFVCLLSLWLPISGALGQDGETTYEPAISYKFGYGAFFNIYNAIHKDVVEVFPNNNAIQSSHIPPVRTGGYFQLERQHFTRTGFVFIIGLSYTNTTYSYHATYQPNDSMQIVQIEHVGKENLYMLKVSMGQEITLSKRNKLILGGGFLYRHLSEEAKQYTYLLVDGERQFTGIVNNKGLSGDNWGVALHIEYLFNYRSGRRGFYGGVHIGTYMLAGVGMEGAIASPVVGFNF